MAEAAQWVGDDVPEEATGRALVLIVDDNADMRRHLQRILSAHWDTLVASDGEEALATARAEKPDLVVTDVMMPGLDGFGFAAAVRADPELAATPLLMLSARAGVESAGDGLASGADDYLPKPFSSQDLVNRVAARLIAASRDRARHEERGRRLAALAEFDTALAEARTPAAVLAALLAAPEVCGRATAAAIGVLEPDRGQVRMTYAGAVPASCATGTTSSPTTRPCRCAT
ncbi:response regulator transcription factor [Actinokineospora soli]|uniref:Response regulator transcription factor n=1 Tax=Actinokineospora soli TaxID=1048753 RepID=A0ABW2TVC7_9PSEU